MYQQGNSNRNKRTSEAYLPVWKRLMPVTGLRTELDISKSTALKIITDTNQSNIQHQVVRVEAKGDFFFFRWHETVLPFTQPRC